MNTRDNKQLVRFVYKLASTLRFVIRPVLVKQTFLVKRWRRRYCCPGENRFAVSVPNIGSF